MFKDIFGDSPQTKILDFLADHPDYDYSISEIAKQAQVSRPTVYKVKDILLKKKLIIQTREQGNSPLYKLNLDNKLVQVILKFDFEIAKRIADVESQESVKKYTHTLEKTTYKTRNKNVVITN
ncbi:MAG: winged helix-turn-helix transcriptional regulator [Candidatus Lokiarchaeota archaeon]|nr:winged helix-turn-helix transcriptional regulator [Candidatus Lokiarchaeota archaeon]